MRTIHRTTIVAKCPLGTMDVYEAEFDVGARFIAVETIQACINSLTRVPVFQEKLTQVLANAVQCRVTLRGSHGAFDTECVAEPEGEKHAAASVGRNSNDTPSA